MVQGTAWSWVRSIKVDRICDNEIGKRSKTTQIKQRHRLNIDIVIDNQEVTNPEDRRSYSFEQTFYEAYGKNPQRIRT